jgi:hypothetical protein
MRKNPNNLHENDVDLIIRRHLPTGGESFNAQATRKERPELMKRKTNQTNRTRLKASWLWMNWMNMRLDLLVIDVFWRQLLS